MGEHLTDLPGFLGIFGADGKVEQNWRDKWSDSDTFTEYFSSLEGQIEYWIVMICYGAFEKNTRRFPMFWYGAQNSLHLYLIHPCYSPFVTNPSYEVKDKFPIEWSLYKVPEGQEHLVDENFLPNKSKMGDFWK